MNEPMTHRYRWRKYRPDLYGRKCRILARGKLNSLMIEFENGDRNIVSRYAVRKLPPATEDAQQ